MVAIGFLDFWPSKYLIPWPSKQQYQEVEKGEPLDEQATFLPDSEPVFLQLGNQVQKTKYLRILTIFNLLILAFSIFINYFRYVPKASLSTNSAIREVSYYCK